MWNVVSKKCLSALCLAAIVLTLSGCDKAKSVVAQKKPLGDCLAEAIRFYANGGSVFEAAGCTVNTGKNNNGTIWINATDVYDGMDRKISVWMPTEWLNVDHSGYQTIAQEFDDFLACFQPQPEPQNQNPLQKQAPVDNGCSQYSLTVNGVPGVGYENRSRALHFSFQALKQQ